MIDFVSFVITTNKPLHCKLEDQSKRELDDNIGSKFNDVLSKLYLIFEPVHEKTNNLGFQQGLTQTGQYNHRRRLEA